MELEEVISILTKLGEVPPNGRSGGLSRVLDIAPGADTEAFLKRLQQNWKNVAPNPLILPDREKDDGEETNEPSETPAQRQTPVSPGEVTGPGGAAATSPAVPSDSVPAGLLHAALFRPQSWEQTAPTSDVSAAQGPLKLTDQQHQQEPPPIVVSVGPDGRLVVSSRDAAALEMFEELAARLAPPRKEYEVFHLKSASASWIVLNLEDFFEDEDAKENNRRNRMMSFMYGMPSRGSSDEDRRRLSDRRPIKFISDLDTNTILVQGADPEQLRIIKDLIELYDVPEPVNSQNARITKLFIVKYSKASLIANTMKDAYRDLLSSNDRALQNANKQNKQQRPPGMTVISMAGFGGDSPPTDTRTSARFDGKLSIGVDDVSNSLLVSTEGENLMSVMEGMIKALDEAAKPVSDVQVVKLGRDTDGARLQETLQKVFGAQQTSSQEAAKPQGPSNQPNGGNGRRPGPGPGRAAAQVSPQK